MNLIKDDRSWLGTAPDTDGNIIGETLNTQVLIVGGGTTGLTAAASCAELGLDVLLIEIKRNFAPMRKEIGAIGSRIQKEEGVDIDAGEVVRQMLMYSSSYIDQKLPLIWARESGEMLDWYENLITARGAKMFLQGGYDFEVKPGSFTKVPAGHNNEWPDGMTGVRVMTEYAESFGAKFMTETGLVKLTTEEGRVKGAVARDMKSGELIEINAAKGVIIATGGYAKNEEMLKALQPETVVMTGLTISEGHTMGDGIKACLWAGAKMDDCHESILFDRCAIMPDETAETRATPGVPTELLGQPFLKVDLSGRRFINESIPYDFIIHRALSLPGKCYCVLFDSGYYEDTKRFELAGCSRMHPFNNGAPCSRPIEINERILEQLTKTGRIVKADTIAGLAEGLGIPAGTLEQTVARYNELYDAGADEDFGKEPHRLSQLRRPPYYGARSIAFLLGTLDGILIDENMNALNEDLEPIEGLYVCGNDSGGFYANTYVNLVTGSCAGRNMTFARRTARVIAGQTGV
jgi:ASC-1-like (ASCH) protein